MICPACGKGMIVVEQNRIELDYCVQCAGVWFDADEMSLLLGSYKLDARALEMKDLPDDDGRGARERRRKCPLCRKKMTKTLIGNRPEVLIDRCRNGEGLWFDGRELDQVLAQMTGGAEGGKVMTFLGEVFTKSSV